MPFAQLLPVPESPNSESSVQKTYPGKLGDARKETSGVNRALVCPEMVTVCHDGCGKPETHAVKLVF
jgi:hypothetical protein